MKFKPGDAFYFKWTYVEGDSANTGAPVGKTMAEAFRICHGERGTIKEVREGDFVVEVVMDSHPHLVILMSPDYCSPHAPPPKPKRSPILELEIT